METQTEQIAEKKTEQVFPLQTEDGFYYADQEDQAMGVETKKYDNGNEVMRIRLSDGRVALVRELKAWEVEESEKFHENKTKQVVMGLATLATKIDDKTCAFEDFKFMKGRDWVKIKYAVSLLNFQ